MINLKDKKFGSLVVIEYLGFEKIYESSRKRNHKWKCKCECGNIVEVLGDSLRSGNTKSCGCIQKEKAKGRLINLANLVFGRLTVLDFSHVDKNGQTYWNCVCECGNLKKINSSSLRNGKSKSCGCRRGGLVHGLSGKKGYKSYYLKQPEKRLRHNIGVAVRDTLKKNKKGSVWKFLPYTSFDLKQHLESKFESWMNWDNYGGKTNSKNKSWHIDHIKPQSSFNYLSMNDPLFLECWQLSNLRPLEKIENIKKGNR